MSCSNTSPKFCFHEKHSLRNLVVERFFTASFRGHLLLALFQRRRSLRPLCVRPSSGTLGGGMGAYICGKSAFSAASWCRWRFFSEKVASFSKAAPVAVSLRELPETPYSRSLQKREYGVSAPHQDAMLSRGCSSVGTPASSTCEALRSAPGPHPLLCPHQHLGHQSPALPLGRFAMRTLRGCLSAHVQPMPAQQLREPPLDP